MDEQARRAAANESAFRTINEQIEALGERLDVPVALVCECARIDCIERLQVPPREYERARAQPRRFVVAPGHEQPQFERVIEQGRGWLLVEKTGEAGDAAAAEDDRTV